MLNKLSARTEPKPFEFFLCSCMFFYRRRQGQREAGGGNKPLKCKVQKITEAPTLDIPSLLFFFECVCVCL